MIRRLRTQPTWVEEWLVQSRRVMGAKRYGSEEIILKLREAEVLLGEGVSGGEVVRLLGVTRVTSHRWLTPYAYGHR